MSAKIHTLNLWEINMYRKNSTSFIFFAMTFISWVGLQAAPPKKLASPVVTKSTPKHRTPIEVDITGAKQLFLEVTDGGDGTSYDWADWIEPRLIGKDGEKKLTDLKWKRLNGRANVGKNQGGGPLKVGGDLINHGIGTHARSLIVYDLPEGYTLFRAEGGLDNGGTDQANSRTSVQFRVSTSANSHFVEPLNVKLLEGFEAERIYSAGVGEIGSWVALGVDGNSLIASDRQGPMYRIVPPPIGSGEQAKIEKMEVEVGHANGLLKAFGSLYVVGKGFGGQGGKSGLFRLTDTTDDGKYDSAEFLMKLAVGSDHHAHAVILSPNRDRLYILCGNSTNPPDELAARHIQHQAEDQLLPRSTYYGHNTGRKAPGGFVVTCKPDGTDRRFLCAGFRNPYDIALNNDGELFTFDADMEYDIGGPWYRPTRVNHCVSGGEFGWRWGAGKWPTYYTDTVGAVVDIGRGSPTGVVFGYGAKFPTKYQDALFICDWTYGRIMAVHLEEHGATYGGNFEEFVAGRGLPVSDIVIHPTDGAMYFIVGGRRNPTSLLRVVYTGTESTEHSEDETEDTPERKLRRLRKQLEAYHGNASPEAIDVAWPHLAHDDRAVRYAARTVLEHQPADSWRERALSETRPLAVIEAMTALARVDDAKHKDAVLKTLNLLNFNSLPRMQQLGLLRAYELTFIRMNGSNDATTQHLIKYLSPHFPSNDIALDRELCQVLLYLNAPGTVAKSVQKLVNAETQAEQMFYTYHLRTIAGGWSDQDLTTYFQWIVQADAHSGDYIGGGHFKNFLKMVRQESEKRLKPEQTQLVKKIMDTKPEPPAIAKLEPREVVKKWTVEDLKPALVEVEANRSFLRGKRLYTAMCSKCHLFGGKGGALGPDLTSVGNKLKPAALLTEIIEPSKVLSDQHASVILQLESGKIVTGREVGGDEKTLKLVVDPERLDQVVEIQKSDIVARKKSPVSLMPLGMLNTLEAQEILDLMAYVSAAGQSNGKAFQQ